MIIGRNKFPRRAVSAPRCFCALLLKKRSDVNFIMMLCNCYVCQAVKVLKALKHYIKTEQKDRVHTITHYQHVQRSNPVEAEAIFAYVADHLRVIDQRLTRALDMLHRLPKQEKKIRQHVGEQ